MKNPFVNDTKRDWWIAGAITGGLAVTAGILYYLHRKRAAADAACLAEHVQDYLEGMKPAKIRHKSDAHDLHPVVPHQG